MALEICTTQDVEKLFENKVKELPNRDNTKSYIIGVFKDVKKKHNFSNESITLIFAKAKSENKFELFQALGDWILFTESVYPQHLKYASKDYYFAMAQISYFRCYRLINKTWDLFEELSDDFPRIVSKLQKQF